MKRLASHNDVIEAGHRMDLSPEGSAKGRVKERKRVEDLKWLEDAVLQAAKDMYAAWKRRGGPEPSLTTSLLRDLAIEGTGGLPEDIKWMTKRQQDLMVLNALQKLKRKGLVEVSTGASQRGGEAKVWNPVSAVAKVIPCGDCFRYATQKAREFGDDAVVVHAVVVNPDPAPGERPRYEHAWVEFKGKVYDWQTEHFKRQPSSLAAFNTKHKPTQEKRYTAEEAMIKGLRSGHHGPWHDLQAAAKVADSPDRGRDVAVGLHFDLTDATDEQKEALRRAQEALQEFGLYFDTSTGFDNEKQQTVRDWEWDWSLKGPVSVDFRNFTDDDPENRYARLKSVARALLATASYLEVTAEFKRPFDAWKKIKPGRQPLPQPLEGHDKAWRKVAARLGIDHAKGVMQLAPVLGGRRRYHHRPLTSWLLPDKKTTLTLTTDKLEGQSWNRLKNKRHVAMPRIHDVFELRLSGVKEPLWAIVHERVTWPVDPDWDLFVDTLFRWRAMQKNALTPAQPKDLEDFLRFIVDPEKTDPVTTRRRRVETALPFKMMNDRRADIAARRRAVWKDPGLEAKIAWAKSTLKFLRANKIRHRDLDPSNLAKTLKGRTVVTNIAESRSKGKKIGRLGRVSSAVDPITHDPFGPTPAAPALRTAQAINVLLDPEAPLMEQLQILSTETRNLNMQIHQDEAMRAAVQEAAFQVGYPTNTVMRGLEKLADLAERSGGKAVPLAEACLAKLAPNLSLPPPPVVASTNYYKKKRRVRRAAKMKKIVDTIVNVAEYLED